VKQLGPRDRPCLHSYYDISPGEPDGDRVLASAFLSDEVPGTAEILLLDAAGQVIKHIGTPAHAIGHVGRFALWMDRDRIAYREDADDGNDEWFIYHMSDGRCERRPGRLRQWHQATGRGLVQTQGKRENPHRLSQGIVICDDDGQMLTEIDVADCAAACPEHIQLPEIDRLNMMNAKWSPDGRRFFTVLTDQVYYRDVVDSRTSHRVFKCLIGFEADGSGAYFIGKFSHHPSWMPNGQDIIAFLEGKGGVQDLVSFSLARGGSPELILKAMPGIHPSMMSDGRILTDICEANQQQASICLFDPQTATRRELMRFSHQAWQHTTGHHPHPVANPAGDAVYLNAAPEGRCGLYRLQIVEGNLMHTLTR
jgi:hypothetical protein